MSVRMVAIAGRRQTDGWIGRREEKRWELMEDEKRMLIKSTHLSLLLLLTGLLLPLPRLLLVSLERLVVLLYHAFNAHSVSLHTTKLTWEFQIDNFIWEKCGMS